MLARIAFEPPSRWARWRFKCWWRSPICPSSSDPAQTRASSALNPAVESVDRTRRRSESRYFLERPTFR